MSLVHLLLFLLFLWFSSYVPKSDGRLARQGEPHLVRSKQLDKSLPLWEAKVEAKPEAAFDSAFFAPFLNDLLDFVLSAMDLPLSVGDNGASSSKRPRFDLNLPIASEPEPEPASTSDPKEGGARNRTQEFPSEVLVFSFLLLL